MLKYFARLPIKKQILTLLVIMTSVIICLSASLLYFQWQNLAMTAQLSVPSPHGSTSSFYVLGLTAGIISTILIIVLYLAHYFNKHINDCFSALKSSLERGANGDFSRRITHIKSSGETKEIQELSNTFMDQTDVFIREASSSMKAASKEQYHRKMLVKGFKGEYLKSANDMNKATSSAENKAQELQMLMKELEDTVKSVVTETSNLAKDMRDTSTSMLFSSKNSVDKSNEVGTAAGTAQDSTTTVASAVEEMSASICEISSQTVNSLDIITKAQQEIRDVSAVVDDFGNEVQGISSIVELIKDIAEQTNLLALNATIEAARAGDAGKGFAVVASEVKHLAGQTGTATEDITKQIEAIQSGSDKIISGVNGISTIMDTVMEISNTISAAVEEQNAVTKDISGNMQNTSQNVTEVQNNITSIRDTLEDTAGSATNLSSMTNNISDNISVLDQALERVINSKGNA